MPVLVGEQAVDTLNILWSEENHMMSCWSIFHSHEMQVNIEEDDTRIYVDIGYGGYVR